jgi:hypothetical protein
MVIVADDDYSAIRFELMKTAARKTTETRRHARSAPRSQKQKGPNQQTRRECPEPQRTCRDDAGEVAQISL